MYVLISEFGNLRLTFRDDMRSAHGSGLRDILAIRRRVLPYRPIHNTCYLLRLRNDPSISVFGSLPRSGLSRPFYIVAHCVQCLYSHFYNLVGDFGSMHSYFICIQRPGMGMGN